MKVAKARLEHVFGGVNPSWGLRFECGCPIWLVERGTEILHKRAQRKTGGRREKAGLPQKRRVRRANRLQTPQRGGRTREHQLYPDLPRTKYPANLRLFLAERDQWVYMSCAAGWDVAGE